MTLTSEAGLVAALAAPVSVPFAASAVTAGAGQFVPILRNNLMPPTQPATPSTSGAALDRTSTGALTIPGSGGGNSNYVVGWSWFQLTSVSGHVAILYDRLVETGGLDGTVTTAQTVNSASLPSRNTSGANVELWLDIYSTLGSTGVTATASYTNQAGTASRSATCVLPATPRVSTLWPFTLQAGDTGVRSVQSVTLSGTTGTAGNFGITLRQQIGPMLHYGEFQALSVEYGWAETGLALVPADAFVEIVFMSGATNTQSILGWLRSVQG